jgi:hypothetical protein
MACYRMRILSNCILKKKILAYFVYWFPKTFHIYKHNLGLFKFYCEEKSNHFLLERSLLLYFLFLDHSQPNIRNGHSLAITYTFSSNLQNISAIDCLEWKFNSVNEIILPLDTFNFMSIP